MPDNIPMIADLRSTLVLIKTTQTVTPGNPSKTTHQQIIGTIRAQVVPLKASNFIGGNNLDLAVADVTHYALIRTFSPQLDIFETATETFYNPDGTATAQTFRIVGVAFVDPQRRFQRLEMKLVNTTPVVTI